MFKKKIKGHKWNGKGFSILIVEENEALLRKLGADVFEDKPKKKKKQKDDSPE
tara:strand:- start:136 stop:294 length:159 start_codon:yes stop_codon:yes gene_type:complete